MDDINYSKKQLFLSLSAIALVLGFISFVAIITAVVWVPLLVMSLPFLLVFAILVKYTAIGDPFLQVYYKVYDWFFYKSERPRKFLWSFIYNTMCMMYPQTQWKAMNYGYSVLSDQGSLIKNLSSEDEDERFCLQLYHYVATLKNLNGIQILEVGSGRGGGLNYLSRYLNPANCVGVDFSENQVRFCQSQYASNKKISFFQGDSEHLDEIPAVKENSFDMVINIESSHCYGSFDAFINQVNRALKPGGFFCFTDFRSLKEAEDLKKYFESVPFFDFECPNIYLYIEQTVTKYEDITINVIQSLKQDEKRRTNLIEGNVSSMIKYQLSFHFQKVLKPFFRKFSGLQGTRIYQEFLDRKTLYVAYILQKKQN